MGKKLTVTVLRKVLILKKKLLTYLLAEIIKIFNY